MKKKKRGYRSERKKKNKLEEIDLGAMNACFKCGSSVITRSGPYSDFNICSNNRCRYIPNKKELDDKLAAVLATSKIITKKRRQARQKSKIKLIAAENIKKGNILFNDNGYARILPTSAFTKENNHFAYRGWCRVAMDTVKKGHSIRLPVQLG